MFLKGDMLSGDFAPSDFMPFKEGVGYDPLNSEFRRRIPNLPLSGKFVVSAKDEYRLDLISYRLYGSTSYWWILLDYNSLSSAEDVVVGAKLAYPSLSEVSALYSSIVSQQSPEDDDSPQETVDAEQYFYLNVSEPGNNKIVFSSSGGGFAKIKLDPPSIMPLVDFKVKGLKASLFRVEYIEGSESGEDPYGFFRVYPLSQNVGSTFKDPEDIVVTVEFSYNDLIAYVNIYQYGDSKTSQIYFEDGSNSRILNFNSFPKSVETIKLTVDSPNLSISPYVSPRNSWIEVKDISEEYVSDFCSFEKVGDDSINIRFRENDGSSRRSLSLFLASDEKSSPLAFMSFSQAAKHDPYESPSRYMFLTFSQNSVDTSFTPGNLKVRVYSIPETDDGKWNITGVSTSSGDKWVTAERDGDYININFLENNTGKSRTSVISVSMTYNGGTQSFDLPVNQSYGELGVPSADSPFTVSDNSLSMDFVEFSKTIKVSSIFPDWIVGRSEFYFNIIVSENKNNYIRQGSVEFKNLLGGSAVSSVIQYGYNPHMYSEYGAYSFPYTSTSKTFKIEFTDCLDYSTEEEAAEDKFPRRVFDDAIAVSQGDSWISIKNPLREVESLVYNENGEVLTVRRLKSVTFDVSVTKNNPVVDITGKSSYLPRQGGVTVFSPEGNAISISIVQYSENDSPLDFYITAPLINVHKVNELISLPVQFNGVPEGARVILDSFSSDWVVVSNVSSTGTTSQCTLSLYKGSNGFLRSVTVPFVLKKGNVVLGRQTVRVSEAL